MHEAIQDKHMFTMKLVVNDDVITYKYKLGRITTHFCCYFISRRIFYTCLKGMPIDIN